MERIFAIIIKLIFSHWEKKFLKINSKVKTTYYPITKRSPPLAFWRLFWGGRSAFLFCLCVCVFNQEKWNRRFKYSRHFVKISYCSLLFKLTASVNENVHFTISSPTLNTIFETFANFILGKMAMNVNFKKINIVVKVIAYNCLILWSK